MKFEDWIDEASENIKEAVQNKAHEKSIISRSNHFESSLFSHYKEFKIFKETRRLVWATWALVIVTWILIFKEEILSFLSRLFTQA